MEAKDLVEFEQGTFEVMRWNFPCGDIIGSYFGRFGKEDMGAHEVEEIASDDETPRKVILFVLGEIGEKRAKTIVDLAGA